MANIKLTEEQIMKREALMRKYSSSSPGKPVGPKGPGPVGPGHGRKGMKGGRPRQTKAVIKRVFGYLSQSYLKIGSALLCVVISTVATLYGTYLLKPVINGLDDTAAPVEERIKKLSVTLLYMALIYGVGVAASYLQQKIMVGVSQGAIVKIRQDLFNKLQKLPVKYHDTHSHGELMSRFTNDLDSVSEMLNKKGKSMDLVLFRMTTAITAAARTNAETGGGTRGRCLRGCILQKFQKVSTAY